MLCLILWCDTVPKRHTLWGGIKEPADHLAVFLAVFAHWLQTERQAPTNAAAEQARFLEEALLNWLPLWKERCRQLHLKTKVYPALAALLLAFVQADKAYLRGE